MWAINEENHTVSDKTQTPEETCGSHKSSRRAMLRLAVPAAAGVAALAATELRPGTAHAAPARPLPNGNPIVIGSQSNSGTSLTELAMTTTGGLGAFEGLDESSASSNSFGVAGVSLSNGGIYGLGGSGLVGPDDTIDKSYTGVYGHVHNNSGSGTVGTGYGVKAHANRGAAPLLLLSTTGTSANGAPSTNAADGAVNVDNNGSLYSRRFGAWYPLKSLTFLPKPIRLLDTRVGAAVGNDRPGAPIGYLGTLNVPAAGVTYSGQTIPSGASAIFGVLTAALAPGVNCGDGSSAICWATGATKPAAVAVVFNPQDLHGAYTSTFIMVETGTSGDVSIFNQPINPVAVDYILDCVGYVI
jgi:hypothetical protein